MSWEARLPSTSGFSGWPSARLGDFGCAKLLAQLQKFLSLPKYFISKDGLFTLRHTRDGQLSNECRKLFL